MNPQELIPLLRRERSDIAVPVVVSRQKSVAAAAAALALGVVIGATVAAIWAERTHARERDQLRSSIALADRYAQELSRATHSLAASDFAGGAPRPADAESAVAPSQAAASSPVLATQTPEASAQATDEAAAQSSAEPASQGLPPQPVQTAAQPPAQPPATVAPPQSAEKPAPAVPPQPPKVEERPQKSEPAKDKPKESVVVRTTMAAASISELGPDFVRFRSGGLYRVGQVLPSGARLMYVDAAAGRLVTSQKTLQLTDYKPPTRTRTAEPKPEPVSSASAPGAATPASGSGQSGARSVAPAPPAASIAAPAAQAAPIGPTASQRMPPAVSGAQQVVTVTPQQANIAAIDASGVRFMSGRTVGVGEVFPSGERLLHVVPGEGKIVTDRRTIFLRNPEASN